MEGVVGGYEWICGHMIELATHTRVLSGEPMSMTNAPYYSGGSSQSLVFWFKQVDNWCIVVGCVTFCWVWQ